MQKCNNIGGDYFVHHIFFSESLVDFLYFKTIRVTYVIETKTNVIYANITE